MHPHPVQVNHPQTIIPIHDEVAGLHVAMTNVMLPECAPDVTVLLGELIQSRAVGATAADLVHEGRSLDEIGQEE